MASSFSKLRSEKTLGALKGYLRPVLWRVWECSINLDVDPQKYQRCIIFMPGHPEPVPTMTAKGVASKGGALEFVAEEVRQFHKTLGVAPLQSLSQSEFDLCKAGEIQASDLDEASRQGEPE